MNEPIKKSSLRRFLAYAKPYRQQILLSTSLGLLKYNLPIFFPWILKDVVDNVLTSKDLARLHSSIIFLIILYIAWSIITYFRSFVADRLGHKIIFDLRKDFYAHLQKMSLSYFDRNRTGAIVSRMLQDIAQAQNFVGAAFTNVWMDATSLLMITFLLFRMNGHLAVVALSVLPFYVLIHKKMGTRIRQTSRLAREKMEEISGDLHEKIHGIPIIQAYNQEKREEIHFVEGHLSYLQHVFTNIKNHAFTLSLTGLLTSLAPVFVLWYGGILFIRGNLTLGSLMAFYAYLGMFYNPLNRLSDLNLVLANSRASMDRIFEVFDTIPDVKNRPNARKVEKVMGEIIYEGVHFAYDTLPVLKGIDLEISRGKRVALVGPSGAGKTTIARLLPRFYDTHSGRITLDGEDIRDFTLDSLRKQVAIVPQSASGGFLFSGSVRENILFGKPEATQQEIEKALKDSACFEFVSNLPNGEDTEIGEEGVRVSGGERQRIAIARAFLKDAPILILDEATSSLDAESERVIQEALERLMKGRTTLIIAHRFSTIEKADWVYVVEKGRVVERGTHESLIENFEGLYSRLYRKSAEGDMVVC